MTTTIQGEMPIRLDWRMKQGADFSKTIELYEDDGVTPKNTTGYAMTMKVKSAPNGETYDTLTIGSEITHTPSAGRFVILRNAAAVDAYDWGNAIYDIIITDASNGKTCPFYGEIAMLP